MIKHALKLVKFSILLCCTSFTTSMLFATQTYANEGVPDESQMCNDSGGNNNTGGYPDIQNSGTEQYPYTEASHTSGTVTEVSSNTISEEGCCPKFPIGLMFDNTFSEITGASIFISSLRAYQCLDDALLPNSEGDHSAYTVLGRFGKVIIEDIIFSTGEVAQHEIFGHGARAREFKLPIRRYQVLPYTGYTEYSATRYNQLSQNEKIALKAAGMEGTGVLAKRIRDYWLISKNIDEREAHFYLLNSLDQTFYALSTRKEPNVISDGNDIRNYVREINRWYGKQALTVGQLRQQMLWDFLDPYFFYSAYSMGLYLFDGAKCWEYPMIPIGDYHYLPGFRIVLTPYGPEYQLNNFIRSPDNTIQARLRYGKTDQRRSYGAGVDITRLWSSELINLDAKAEIWNQPRLFKATAGEATPKWGVGLWGTVRWCVFSQLELLGQVGYKSCGYVVGEPLKSGVIFRAGFNVNL